MEALCALKDLRMNALHSVAALLWAWEDKYQVLPKSTCPDLSRFKLFRE